MESSSGPYYKWSNGDTSRFTRITKKGTYFVSVHDYKCNRLIRSDNVVVKGIEDLKANIILANNVLNASIETYKYQWLLNEKVLANSNSRSIAFNKSGCYRVRTYGNDACYAESDTLCKTYQGTSGISDIDQESDDYINIYPNPFSNTSTITIGEQITQPKLKLCNILGQELWTILAKDNQIVVDGSSLSKGIYFLYLYEENDILSVKKIIVEK